MSQLNWRARPEEWSVGQCLEHLYVTNQVYLPPINEALTGQSAARVAEITPGWFGRWFIRNYIEPSPQTKKAKAPKKIAPPALVDASILTRFRESNERVRMLVGLAGRLDVNRIRFANPFIPLLRFTVGTGLEIIVRHQRRHLLQAERIRASAEFPRS